MQSLLMYVASSWLGGQRSRNREVCGWIGVSPWGSVEGNAPSTIGFFKVGPNQL